MVTICMKCQNLLSVKNQKNKYYISFAKILSRVLSVLKVNIFFTHDFNKLLFLFSDWKSNWSPTSKNNTPGHVRPAKTHISVRMRAIWSRYSMSWRSFVILAIQKCAKGRIWIWPRQCACWSNLCWAHISGYVFWRCTASVRFHLLWFFIPQTQLSLTHCSLDTLKGLLANSAYPDRTPQNAASDQGPHCLQTLQPFFSRNI